MDFSDRNAKLNKRLMESWGYNLNEKKTEKGFGEGTPPEGEWYDKKVIVMEDGGLDHPGMCCADAHGGMTHAKWATAQQQGRTEAPAVVSLEEGEELKEIQWKEEQTRQEMYKRAKGACAGYSSIADRDACFSKIMAGHGDPSDPKIAKARQEAEMAEGFDDWVVDASLDVIGGDTLGIGSKIKEGELPPGLEKYKKEKGGEDSSDESDEPSDSGAEASSDDEGDIVQEPEEAPGAENERKKRDEPRNYVGRPGHVQNPLHEHEELVNRVVERVVARLQKS